MKAVGNPGRGERLSSCRKGKGVRQKMSVRLDVREGAVRHRRG